MYMNFELPDVQDGFRKGRRTRYQIANNHWIIEKSKRMPEKHLLLLYWPHQSLWLCGSQHTVENSLRDENTKLLTCLLYTEKSVCRSRSNIRTRPGTTDQFKIKKGVISRLYIVILLISFIFRVHHVKCLAGWSISWNQDCQEKYQ